MASEIYPPEYGEQAFHCPHCGVYAEQFWLHHFEIRNMLKEKFKSEGVSITFSRDTDICTCRKCAKPTVWVWMAEESTLEEIAFDEGQGEWMLMYPMSASVPLPSEDMPEGIRKDYLEAKAIAGASPRGAAALLRLCIQKLMPFLGEPGKRLDDDIGSLVKKGLNPLIQMSLDSVRVIGNEAVHPGVMDLNDNPKTVLLLFSLLNLIIEQMISIPKKTKDIYTGLPEKNLDAIARRDGKQAAENAD